MALVWTEEQQLLREVSRTFLDQHAPIGELRRIRDEVDPDGFSRPLWKEMAELGWAGIPFPEKYGGADLGCAEIGVVMRECGRTLAATPLVGSVLLGGTVVALAGNDTQRKEILTPLCSGERLLTAAIQEGAYHQPYRVATSARRDGNDWVLSGAKDFVIDGHAADQLVVVARLAGDTDDRDGLGLFLVDADAARMSRHRRRMADGRNVAQIVLDDVRVPDAAALGEPGRAADWLDATLDRATAGLCAEMLGGIEAVFDRTLAYLKVREQFGVPIGSFQALKHRAAKMFIEIELSKTVVLEALQALDADAEDAPRLVGIAKAKLGDAAQLISNEGVQMHGGIGVTDEEDVGLFLKRCRVQQRTFGDTRFHRDRVASLNGF
ncbi:MAG: acyl-CoA dehydrogenase [Myxococcota bacterium]|nr:acyl-CoA dehydrogenase [Myxococcota bacterium]